jgi:hypothetical protein
MTFASAVNTSDQVADKKIPDVMAGGMVKRTFPGESKKKKKRKKKKRKDAFKKILESSGSGNWDWWNEPKEIGKNWKEFFPTLKKARKSNYFDTNQDNYGTGKTGKMPGVFHKMGKKKKSK